MSSQYAPRYHPKPESHGSTLIRPGVNSGTIFPQPTSIPFPQYPYPEVREPHRGGGPERRG